MSTSHCVIELSGVCFAYGDEPALEDVTFTIAKGDFACVIGPNGGGKTTLLKLLLGLLTPDRGHIQVLGTSPERASPKVGYLPQHPRFDAQFPVTVSDVVLMGRLGRGRSFGRYAAHDKAVALRALEEVGLDGMPNRPFGALSGGQRQRVLVARALACEPELLLLDEPTASLDPAVQEDLLELLSRLNVQWTIVLVSHDLGFVSTFFRTVVCVNRRVHVHPIHELTNKQVADMYGRQVRVVHGAAAPTSARTHS